MLLLRSQTAPLFAAGWLVLVAAGTLALPTPVFAAEPQQFSIAIEARKVDPGRKTIRVMQGQALELAFTADETIELHLHGYNQFLTVNPGSVAVMRLQAKIAGRFAIEAHRFGSSVGRQHVVLLYLEVHPR